MQAFFYIFLRNLLIFSVAPAARPGIEDFAYLLQGSSDAQKMPVQAWSAVKHFFYTCFPAFSLHRHFPPCHILIYAGHAQKVHTCSSPHGDEFVDRIADLGEFFFILCHDIVFIHFFIMMQIISKCLQCPCGLFDLLQ